MNTPKTLNQAPSQETEAPKQPYEKPEVIYRAPLEAVAGQCTPTIYDNPPGPGKGGVGCTVLTS